MGGNAATQSLALIVRGIALGNITAREAWNPLMKQLITGLIQGLAVGLAVGLSVFLWKGNAFLGLIMFIAILGNMLVAVLMGTLIPLILKSLNLDPALASAVLVTAVTDSVGFALFLGLAALFLPYLR
jgi:magnesium transporter